MKTIFVVVVFFIAFLSFRGQVAIDGEQSTNGPIEESVGKSPSPDVTSFTSGNGARDESFIDKWAQDIRIGYFENFKSLATTDSLNEILPRLIRIAYSGNLNYFDNILRFVSELPHPSNIVVGYQALFDSMNKNGQLYHNTRILKLAYKVKTAMRNENGKEQFENLKKQFPVYIQQLIWNSSCSIKNNHWNEYLFSGSDDTNYDSERGRVFTWIPGNQVIGRWNVEPEDEAEYFTIKSYQFNKYLIAGNKNFSYDSQKRRVFTWLPGNKLIEGNWILEPAGDNYYKLKNKLYNEYLYAAGDMYNYDNNNRRVFTWIGGDIVDGGYWSIYCD